MSTETLILLGIGVYVVLMLAIGFYASRGAHSLTDFIVASGPFTSVPTTGDTVPSLNRSRSFLPSGVAPVNPL